MATHGRAPTPRPDAPVTTGRRTPAMVPASVTSATFRLPRSAYLAVLFLAFCVTPLVQHPWAAFAYLVPLAAAGFVARAATVVDRSGLRVRALFGTRRLSWDEVRSLAADERGRVSVLSGPTQAAVVTRLPFVRARHLPVLTALSGQDWPTAAPDTSHDSDDATENSTGDDAAGRHSDQ